MSFNPRVSQADKEEFAAAMARHREQEPVNSSKAFYEDRIIDMDEAAYERRVEWKKRHAKPSS